MRKQTSFFRECNAFPATTCSAQTKDLLFLSLMALWGFGIIKKTLSEAKYYNAGCDSLVRKSIQEIGVETGIL